MDGGPSNPQNAYQCARIFFLRALNELQKHGKRRLSPRGVSALFFFPLARLLQVLRRRPGVLAHPPLLPPRARPVRLSSYERRVGPALWVQRPAPRARGARHGDVLLPLAAVPRG